MEGRRSWNRQAYFIKAFRGYENIYWLVSFTGVFQCTYTSESISCKMRWIYWWVSTVNECYWWVSHEESETPGDNFYCPYNKFTLLFGQFMVFLFEHGWCNNAKSVFHYLLILAFLLNVLQHHKPNRRHKTILVF